MCVYFLSYACYMSHLSQLVWFNHTNPFPSAGSLGTPFVFLPLPILAHSVTRDYFKVTETWQS
jgi:hypothetical protein